MATRTRHRLTGERMKKHDRRCSDRTNYGNGLYRHHPRPGRSGRMVPHESHSRSHPRLIDAICGSNKAATRRVRDVDGKCQNFAAAARAVATFLLHKALRR
jgi:hypothetical protein